MKTFLLALLIPLGLISLALVVGLLRMAGETSRAEEVEQERREREQTLRQQRAIAAHVEHTTRGGR